MYGDDWETLKKDYFRYLERHTKNKKELEQDKKLINLMKIENENAEDFEFLEGKDFRNAAVDVIQELKSKTNKEYEVFNRFFDYLEISRKYKEYHFEVERLPRQLTPLERQIEIAKMLQKEDFFDEDAAVL